MLGGCIADAARLLATFGFDDCVRLWALDSGQCINCIKLPDTPQVGSGSVADGLKGAGLVGAGRVGAAPRRPGRVGGGCW